MGIGMMITVYIISLKRNYPRMRRGTFRELLISALGAWTAYLAPFIIIGGILSGIFTPTEASVVASLYAMVISILVYKEITLK